MEGAERVCGELDDLPVIGHESVALALHVGELGIDGGGEPLLPDVGEDLAANDLFVGAEQSLAAVKELVAEDLSAPAVLRQGEGVAAVLCEAEGAAVVFQPDRAEV